MERRTKNVCVSPSESNVTANDWTTSSRSLAVDCASVS